MVTTYMCIYNRVTSSISVCVYLYISLSKLSVCFSVLIFVCVFIFMYVWLYVCLCVCLSNILHMAKYFRGKILVNLVNDSQFAKI